MCSLAGAGRAAAGPETYLLDRGTLLVADTANPSIVARIPLGGGGASPTAGAAGGRVYVAVTDEQGSRATRVAVVDTASRTILSTIPLGVAAELSVPLATPATTPGAHRGWRTPFSPRYV